MIMRRLAPLQTPFNSTPTITSSTNSKTEIRVCTNKACRRQGSMTILETLVGIAPAHVSVKPCSCFGRCGAGPNLVVLPQGAIVGHCGTHARAAELMVSVCGGGGDDAVRRCLEGLALRKRAEVELERKNFAEAEALFTQVIETKPIGGIHIAYKGRSAVRLASGNYLGALEDSNESLAFAPKYADAYICQGDAFLAMDQLEAAETSFIVALENEPSLRRSKLFKARVQMLQEKMASGAVP